MPLMKRKKWEGDSRVKLILRFMFFFALLRPHPNRFTSSASFMTFSEKRFVSEIRIWWDTIQRRIRVFANIIDVSVIDTCFVCNRRWSVIHPSLCWILNRKSYSSLLTPHSIQYFSQKCMFCTWNLENCIESERRNIFIYFHSLKYLQLGID